MGEDKIVFVLLAVLFTALTSINAEKFKCPCGCHCSVNYTTVKCRGLEKFPALKFAGDVRFLDLSQGHITDINKTELEAYESLQHLDIRNNGIKSVSPGLFSEMKSLRELFIDGNPWSCDESTLQVMQMELIALADEKLHLENFDGGKIECFDPPDMKGKKPLQSINPITTVYRPQKSHQEADITRAIILVSILMVIFLFVICGIVYKFRGKLLCCIKKSKPVTDQASKMEAGELGNKSSLANSKKEGRRKSRGTTHDDEGQAVGAVKDEKFNILLGDLINRMEKRRRMSQGLPASAKRTTSSLDEVNRREVDLPDKLEGQGVGEVKKDEKYNTLLGDLINRMEKKRRMSQGLPASAKSSTSSLDEVNGGEVDLPDKLEGQDVGEVKRDEKHNNLLGDLINRMERTRRLSQGLPAPAKRSSSSVDVDGGVADLADKLESNGKRDSQIIFIDDIENRRRMSQGLPASSKSSYPSLIDSMDKTGEPLVPEVRSSCNSNEVDKAVVHSPMKLESQGPLHEESTLSNNMMESDHVSQDVSVSNTSCASSCDDDIFHSPKESGSFAEEEADKSDEEGYSTP